MFDTRSKALKKIRTLGLPPVFERIWNDEGPPQLRWAWKAPLFFFEIKPELVGKCPRIDTCVPLLEGNRERVVGFDDEKQEFIDYYYDDSECEVIGKTYQQFVSALFAGFAYAGLVDAVQAMAADFEYRYLDAFLKFAAEESDLDAGDAIRLFVQSIGEREQKAGIETHIQAPGAIRASKRSPK